MLFAFCHPTEVPNPSNTFLTYITFFSLLISTIGVPFNIASYALLTRMIAEVTGLKPGDFVHALGDAHVYTNHVDALKVQIEREPKPFPVLKFKREVRDIEAFQVDDFVIDGYEPWPKIEMQMAV